MKVFFYNTIICTGHWRFDPDATTHDLDMLPFVEYYKSIGAEIHTNVLYKSKKHLAFNRHPDITYHEGSPNLSGFDEVITGLTSKAYYFLGGKLSPSVEKALRVLFLESELKNPIKFLLTDPRPGFYAHVFRPQAKWYHKAFLNHFTENEMELVMDKLLNSDILFGGRKVDTSQLEGNRRIFFANYSQYVPLYLPEPKKVLDPTLWQHDLIYPFVCDLKGKRKQAIMSLYNKGLDVITIRRDLPGVPLMTKDFMGKTLLLETLAKSRFQLVDCEPYHLDAEWSSTPRCWQSLANNSLVFRSTGPAFESIGGFNAPLIVSPEEAYELPHSQYETQVEAYMVARQRKMDPDNFYQRIF